jgi:hypothetical protein
MFVEKVVELVEPSYKVIVRHGPPNKYDHAEQGTICKVIGPDGYYDIYRQTNPDDSNPIWVRM